jgi:hypothetical protein
MNEAETRAEHIDPALKAAGWGVAEGSRDSARIPHYAGPPAKATGRRGKALIRRLRAGIPQHQAGRDRSQGVGI